MIGQKFSNVQTGEATVVYVVDLDDSDEFPAPADVVYFTYGYESHDPLTWMPHGAFIKVFEQKTEDA